MGRALAITAPGRIELIDEPDPSLGAGEVRVRTLFSGVSAGTELTLYRGTNPYLERRWDAERRLFVARPPDSSPAYPVVGWGYEEVGEVVEAGADVDPRLVGRRLHGAWGHRSLAVLRWADAAGRALPPGLDPTLGVFVRVGQVALNGVLDAGINVGETVAVFGLGVVGQVVAQLARLSGARVVGVDPIVGRRELAGRLGLHESVDGDGAAERIRELTGGRGADVCVEASGSTRALHEAIRAGAYGARVVALGFYQGEATGLRLGEEFHHNRIELISSQISGVAPRLGGRWDHGRLARTVLAFAESRQLDLSPLVSHVIPIDRAAELFALLDARPAEALQVVLSFGDEAGGP